MCASGTGSDLISIGLKSQDLNNYIATVNQKFTGVISNNKPAIITCDDNNVLKQKAPFYNNSCIWVRVKRKDYDDKEIKKEYDYFKNIGLYNSEIRANEYFEFHNRVVGNNFINGDHANNVTPIAYGDETEFLKMLQENKVKSCENGFEFDIVSEKVEFKHLDKFHKVSIRILVVDDKIGACVDPIFKKIEDLGEESQGIMINGCVNNCCNKKCKLRIIKELMKCKEVALFPEEQDDKKLDYFYWDRDNINCFFVPDVMEDFLDGSSLNAQELSVYDVALGENAGSNDGKLFVKLDSGKMVANMDKGKKVPVKEGVQIVGVKDVRTALLLLSKYKFDMLFFDYLLYFKNEEERKKQEEHIGIGERDYSIQFFEFLAKKQPKDILEKFRHNILFNRGPLDKFWIMPITAFNSTFITELQKHYVPLIGTRWHINHGADPINTPWQFLFKLNQFIGLQLKLSVFKKDKLLRFLQYTGGEDLKNGCGFSEFQSFMGAEYSSFMSHYGSRMVIKRDAVIGSDTTSTYKSLFSTYIWENFYLFKDGDLKVKRMKNQLFSLYNLMEVFYKEGASMPEDRVGVLRLREAFRRLRYYIDANGIGFNGENGENDEKDKKDEELKNSLRNISDVIDGLLNK